MLWKIITVQIYSIYNKKLVLVNVFFYSVNKSHENEKLAVNCSFGSNISYSFVQYFFQKQLKQKSISFAVTLGDMLLHCTLQLDLKSIIRHPAALNTD